MLHGILEEYINRVWWYILIKSCIYRFLIGIHIYSCVRFRKHSRVLFHLMIWYLVRSISPITPGLIHRSFLETKLHICLKLRSAIGFCISMHAHGSCPEHRTIPAPFVREKLPVRQKHPPDVYYKCSECWPSWERFFLRWFFII